MTVKKVLVTRNEVRKMGLNVSNTHVFTLGKEVDSSLR